jgi:hypothetical protein
MDKVTATNLKRNLDEARKVWAKYPGECKGAEIQYCGNCIHLLKNMDKSYGCSFELAPLTMRGLPCPYFTRIN